MNPLKTKNYFKVFNGLFIIYKIDVNYRKTLN